MRKPADIHDSLAYKRPDLVAEWDYESNGDKRPENFTVGSGESVNWKCPKCGYVWTARINDRCHKNTRCKACYGTHAVKGFSDLATTRPDLAAEWDYENNPADKTPFNLKANSHFRAHWICPEGHHYQKRIEDRNNGYGCTVCEASRKTYLSSNKELSEEWDYESNGSLEGITIGSGKPYYWICRKCGNRWKATVHTRSSGHGCERCSKKEGARKKREAIAKKTHNTIAEKRPDLLLWWDYEKNIGTNPERVLCTSSMKFYWKCPDCGYPFRTTVEARIRSKKCRICAGRGVWPGHNDLKTVAPHLAEEWDFERNGGRGPDSVSLWSSYNAQWKCSICGNEWPAKVSDRARGNGCPQCALRSHSSFPEQAVLFYAQRLFPDSVSRMRFDWLGKSEIDIFIPSLSIGIEYDGSAWHKNSNRDEKKGLLIAKNGIRLYRIREEGCPVVFDESICIQSKKYRGTTTNDDLSASIRAVFLSITGDITTEKEIDVARDYYPIVRSFLTELKNDSVAARFPEIAAEWDKSLNGGLGPELFNYGNTFPVNWRCSKCNYIWSARIDERCGPHKTGCPVCGGRIIAPGINDFATRHPDLLTKWDYLKNDELGIKPNVIPSTFRKPVNWICEKGHEFTKDVAAVVRGYKCPFCSNKQALFGFNDLKTLYPLVAEDWDYEKNEQYGITPETVVFNSSKEVSWKCHICGHSWKRVIGDRTVRKHGCKKCSDMKKRNTP